MTYYGYFSIFYSSFFMNLYYNWNIDMFCSKMFLKDNMLNTGTLMNYNCISFYSFDSEDNTSNFLKDQGRKCRFCSEENQTFNKEAHAIPEALGNKTLFSYYECDTCNDKFSVFENDLKNFLEIPIRHCMINNKKNYQNYLKPSEENNFGGQIFNDKDFSLLVGNDLLNFKEEEIKNELVISFDVETQKFIPLNVYRALIKIFLTLVDEKTFKKLEFLKKVFEDSYKPVNKLIIKEKLIGDKIFTNSIVLLLEKKVSSPLYSNPQYLMILRLKNYIYEIPIDLGMIENRTINFNSLIIDDLTFYIPEFYNFKSKIHYKLSDQTDYDLNIRNLVSSIKIEKDINYSGFNPPPNSKLIDLSDNKFIIRKSRIYYGSSLFYKLKDIREETLKKFIKNPQFINLPKDIRIRTFKNLKDVIKKIRNKELKNKLLILIKDFENSFF